MPGFNKMRTMLKNQLMVKAINKGLLYLNALDLLAGISPPVFSI